MWNSIILKFLFFSVISPCILNSIVTGFADISSEAMMNVKELNEMAELCGEIINGFDKLQNSSMESDVILNELKVVHKSMNNIEELIKLKHTDIISALLSLSNMETVIEKINRYADTIDRDYNTLMEGMETHNASETEDSQMKGFLKKATGSGIDQLPYMMREFSELIEPFPYTKDGIIKWFAKYAASKEANGDWCDNSYSLSEFIYRVYLYSLKMFTKGYLAILGSYSLRKTFNEGKFTTEIRFTQHDYRRAVNNLVKHMHDFAAEASTSVRRCDPTIHQRGGTYLELTHFIQGFVTERRALSKEHSISEECENFDLTFYYPHQKVLSDGNWKCSGMIRNCKSPHIERICPSSTPTRRFDGFITSDTNFTNAGNTTNCDNGKGISTIVLDPPSEEWEYQPELCACLCDDAKNPQTLRKFSAYHVLSDYKNNMVITGIQLVNRSNVIHIDIQQGKLENFGYINPNTVNWRRHFEIIEENKELKGRKEIVLAYQENGLKLDAINAAAGEVLIGVKFEYDPLSEALQLVALVTKFDFPSGKLDTENTKWISQSDQGTTRTEIQLNDAHIPTLCNKNVPITRGPHLVRFQPSDWKKDAAQTTIPFLDAQPVTTNPPSILGGVGLYYRGAPGCGGFVGFELFTYSYAHLIASP